MDSTIILIILTVLTLGMLGANNASNSAGAIAGSKILSYRNGILVFIAGLAVGTLLEGGKLSSAIQGNALEGVLGPVSVDIILGVTFAILLIATSVSLPLPIAQAIFGASIGSGIYLGLPVRFDDVVLVVISWAMTPLIAVLIAFLVSRFLHRYTFKGLNTTVVMFSILTLLASFYTAYTFGANTLGLIIGVTKGELGWPVAAGVAIVATGLGGIIMGERVSRTVGEGIASLGPPTAFASQLSSALTVHLFTQAAVPVSISQSTTGAIAGVGLGRGIGSISKQTAIKLAVLWTATPLFSLVMSWLLHAVILG